MVDTRWGSDAVDTRGANLPALKARFLVDRMPKTGRVCEIGSGDGKLLRTLAAERPGLALDGCDVRVPQSPTDAYEFRQITPGAPLPYDDATFDVVILFDVLEHVPEPTETLAEAARILNTGGRLLAFVPIEGELRSFYELYRRVLGEDTYVITKEHVHAFSHEGLRRIVARRFEITATEYAYHPLGHFMDATFFAATRMERLRRFWWQENVYYAGTAPRPKKPSLASRALNGLLQLGNLAAYTESKLLAKAELGAAGVLIEARARRAT